MKMKSGSVLSIFALVLSLTATNARAADLAGTWRLSSWIQEETESKIIHKPFGEHPSGLITYTADGHMMVIFSDPSRKPSASPKPTDAEATELYRTMVAYAGTYTVDGNRVTHKIEVSWNQAWNGTNQVRSFDISDEHLTIKTQAFVSPFLNKQIVATLVFERVK